jgi:hypothetical protein
MKEAAKISNWKGLMLALLTKVEQALKEQAILNYRLLKINTPAVKRRLLLLSTTSPNFSLIQKPLLYLTLNQSC